MKNNDISERKLDHLRLCARKDVDSEISPGFEEIILPHAPLPELSLSDIDMSTKFLGKKLKAPVIVTGMTGGAKGTEKINKKIASMCEKYGLGFGVGSQRAAIESPELSYTYEVRDVFSGLLFGNLGLVQFVKGYGEKEAKKAIDMIDADYLAIHLNPAQEACQEGGDTDFKGGLKTLKKISSKVPVVAKETGCGIGYDSAKKLKKAGVKAIDVAGLGGTSWPYIDSIRSKSEENKKCGKTFRNWGIRTADSIFEAKSAGLPLIGSGGIRSGLDAAKAITLGADCVGVALPVLRAYFEKNLENFFETFLRELKVSMFLTSAGTIKELKKLELFSD